MQAKIVASGFSQDPLSCRVVIEFKPENQAEHDDLIKIFDAKMTLTATDASKENVLRMEFEIKPDGPLPPSAADLDTVAEELKIKQAAPAKAETIN